MVRSPSLLRFARIAALAAAVIAALVQLRLLLPPAVGADFVPLRHAATSLLAGHSVYSDPGFVYPPTAAILLTPVAAGSLQHAFDGWLALSLTGLVLTVALIARAATAGRRAALAAAAIALLLGGSTASDSLWIGNMSVVLVPLAVGTVLLFARRRWRGGTGLLCFSLLLKPLLFPLLAVPVLHRRWRAALPALLATALALVTTCAFVPGGGNLLHTLSYCLRATNLHGSNVVNNLSFSGWAEARDLPGALTATVRAVVLGVVAAALLRRGRRNPALDAATVFGAALLVGPICEPHYLLTLGATELVVLATSADLRRHALALGPGLAMLVVPSSVRDAVCPTMLDRQTWYVVAQAVSLSGLCVATLLQAPDRVPRPGAGRRAADRPSARPALAAR